VGVEVLVVSTDHVGRFVSLTVTVTSVELYSPDVSEVETLKLYEALATEGTITLTEKYLVGPPIAITKPVSVVLDQEIELVVFEKVVPLAVVELLPPIKTKPDGSDILT
jgi:hypothetical protein